MPGRFFLKKNLPSGNLKGFSENGIETGGALQLRWSFSS
jgi:hypothetical protein